MRINFFEEFPTPENLEKIVPLPFSSTVYLAARSLEEFRALRKPLSALNSRVQPAYWPVLSKSYWISPFCDTEELERLQKELEGQSEPLRVLIDLEIPVLAKRQIVRNFKNFRSNKRVIHAMFSSAAGGQVEVVAAEYPPLGRTSQRFLESMGLSVPLKTFRHRKMFMFYTTFIKERDVQDTIKNQIVRLNQEYGGFIHVGLGTMATGIFGNEELLPVHELAKQLRFFRDEGIPEATLYRLGGLTDRYLETIVDIATS